MKSQYLNSVLINHESSGFCILEFSLNSSKKPKNAKVIMSTGNSFDDIALTILQNIKLQNRANEATKTVRLPIYFKA